jgi:hypothetical protein
MATEKQLVHDWSTGSLQVYEIEAEIVESGEPPLTEPTDETPSAD